MKWSSLHYLWRRCTRHGHWGRETQSPKSAALLLWFPTHTKRSSPPAASITTFGLHSLNGSPQVFQSNVLPWQQLARTASSWHPRRIRRSAKRINRTASIRHSLTTLKIKWFLGYMLLATLTGCPRNWKPSAWKSMSRPQSSGLGIVYFPSAANLSCERNPSGTYACYENLSMHTTSCTWYSRAGPSLSSNSLNTMPRMGWWFTGCWLPMASISMQFPHSNTSTEQLDAISHGTLQFSNRLWKLQVSSRQGLLKVVSHGLRENAKSAINASFIVNLNVYYFHEFYPLTFSIKTHKSP